MLRFSPFLLCALLAACNGQPPRRVDTSSPAGGAPPAETAAKPDTQARARDPILIATDRRSYRPGDPVELRITNTTRTTYSFNPCTRTVEQQGPGAQGWSAITEDRVCTMVAHMLEPNATRAERTELGEQLKPGTYRLAIRFVPDSQTERSGAVLGYSPPITVTP